MTLSRSGNIIVTAKDGCIADDLIACRDKWMSRSTQRQPPSQNPVFEISQQPHNQFTPNFRSTIFRTPSHPYLISRPGALLRHFLLQELWLLLFSCTPVIPLPGIKPHQKYGIPTTSQHYPLLPTSKTTPTVLRIFP